jgi:hypothetical protein
MDFFIWNIKILIFFNFFVLIRVNLNWPELTHETQDLTFWPGLITMVYGEEEGDFDFWSRRMHEKSTWRSDKAMGFIFQTWQRWWRGCWPTSWHVKLNLHYMVNLRGHFLLLGTPRLISTFILARFLVLSSCSSFRKVQASLTVTINSPLIYYFY